jgi:hypothetical protein
MSEKDSEFEWKQIPQLLSVKWLLGDMNVSVKIVYCSFFYILIKEQTKVRQ